MYITLVYDGDSDIELGGIFGGSVGIKSLQVRLQRLETAHRLAAAVSSSPAGWFALPCPAVRHSCLPSLRRPQCNAPDSAHAAPSVRTVTTKRL